MLGRLIWEPHHPVTGPVLLDAGAMRRMFSSQSLHLIGFGGTGVQPSWGACESQVGRTPHIDTQITRHQVMVRTTKTDRARKAWGPAGYVSRDLSAPGGGNGTYKGPRAGPRLAFGRNREGALVAGAERARGSGMRARGVRAAGQCLCCLQVTLSGRASGWMGQSLTAFGEDLSGASEAGLGAGRVRQGHPWWGSCRCPGRGASAAKSSLGCAAWGRRGRG